MRGLQSEEIGMEESKTMRSRSGHGADGIVWSGVSRGSAPRGAVWRTGARDVFPDNFWVFYLTPEQISDNRLALPNNFDSHRAAFNWPFASYIC